MGIDDFLESEVGTAVAATAVLLSPRVRGIVRSGLVYGLAGAIKVGDVVVGVGRGVARGASDGAASAASQRRAAAESVFSESATEPASPPSARARSGRSTSARERPSAT